MSWVRDKVNRVPDTLAYPHVFCLTNYTMTAQRSKRGVEIFIRKSIDRNFENQIVLKTTLFWLILFDFSTSIKRYHVVSKNVFSM